MNKFKGSLLTAAMLLVGGASLLAVSCKGNDSVVYTFETNGGAAMETVTLNPGEEYNLPAPPEREGYSFEGWYTDPEFTGERVETVLAKTSCTYYAKWEKMYFVTLDLQGGTLTPATEGFYLKTGDNISAAAENYVPSLSGCKFEGWFIGDAALSDTQTMSGADITLTARYTVGYTVEIYKQTLAGDGYEKETEVISGSGYVGSSVTPRHEEEGFTQTETEETVATKTLSADASENVFRLYYDRDEYTVVFHSNYPAGAGGEETVSRTVVYGNAIELSPDFYSAEGYLLLGWAEEPTGGAVYATDFGSMVRNDAENYPVGDFVPSANLDLYAVWSEGCTDLLGGEDRVYLPGENSRVIYLSRNGLLFWGNYDPESREFEFLDDSGDILLEGKMSEDGLYVYRDDNRDGAVSTLYEVGEGLIESTKIYFDSYNGILYTVRDEETGVTSESSGTYVIDEDGLYVVTFDSGELAGEKMTLLVGSVQTSDGIHSAFQIRNEEEYILGTLVRFAVNEGSISFYTTSYMLQLNGFGIATYNAGTSSAANYYYVSEDGKITLMYSNGSVFGVVCIIDEFSRPGYMVYDESFDQTYTSESGATLSMDGLYKATYTNGADTFTGYYSMRASVFGGYIVTIYDESGSGEKRTCYVNAIEETSGEAGGETQTTYRYVMEEKLNSYAEYRYIDEEQVQTAPLFVLDDGQAGKATLYGYDGTQYVRISEGSYVYDEETEKYLYTAEGEILSPEGVQTEPFDLSSVRSVVFGLGASGSNGVSYWYSVTTDEGTDNYDVQYSGTESGETLTLIGGFAVYRAGAEAQPVAGTFSKTDAGLVSVSTDAGYLYFELNEEGKSFLRLQSAPVTAYALEQSGAGNRNVSLSTDGKGGGTYTIAAEEEGGEDTVYTGTVTSTGKTTSEGALIYRFSSEQESFEFIYLTAGLTRYFARYNEQVNGEYTAADGGKLILDGFAFSGKYISAEKVTYEGIYYLAEDGSVCLSVDDDTMYFDLDGRTFTVRGEEYGVYAVLDNQYADGLYLRFDGYGNLAVYRLEEGADGNYAEAYVDEAGTYEKVAGGWRISYTDGNAQYTLEGNFDTVTSGNYIISVFAVYIGEVVTSYLDESDWSVLYLDGCGNAVKYDSMGQTETGSYVVVSDTLFYYVNDAGTDACIYVYDRQAGTIRRSEFSTKGYYTAELESMVFHEYGFMTFNGETKYYYNVEDNGDVFIYRQDPDNEYANRYGFVREEFGEFTNVKEFDGKTYYVNNGYALTFNRAEEGKNKYPVPANDGESYPLESLIFTPGGGLEFSVSGYAYIGGVRYNCTVVRQILEDGSTEMYVGVNYFRFYIDVTYTGEREDGTSDNTFEVVDMKLYIQAPSYAYYSLYYIYYLFYNTAIANTIGEISLISQYNEAGEISEQYVLATFGPDAGLYDSNGDPLPVPEKIPFTQDENTGLYLIEFKGDDGYTYRMHFTLRVNNLVGAIGYYVYGLTRVETLETADGYTLETERCIYSDYGYAVGDYWSVVLYKDGVQLESDVILLVKGTLYYAVREKDASDKILSTVYYKIELAENPPAEVEEGESVPMPTFASVTVTVQPMTTVYDSTGAAYVDRDANGEIVLIWFENGVHLTVESSGDETTGYTVKTNTGRTFSVRFSDGMAFIIDITQ